MATIYGTNGDDVLFSTSGNDVIASFGGDDLIYGSLGADWLDGGDGFDTVRYSAPKSAYTITLNADNSLLITRPDASSWDTLVNVERVIFGDTDPLVVELSQLDGTNGFQINGIGNYDQSGRSVSNAGDVNGDGIGDILIGAPQWVTFPGETYVVFGRTTGFSASMDLSSLDGTNGFQINGITYYDQIGFSVSNAGDVNGDGIDDILIGAPNAGDAGEAYILFGRTAGFSASIDLSSLDGTNGFRIDGIDPGDSAGRSVSSAGDVNGDGIDDILIGAPNAGDAGETYVLFGRSTGFNASIALSALDGTNGFIVNGAAKFEGIGESVSDVGDVNGDGIGDILIGTTRGGQAGRSYVLFGRSSGFSASIDLSTLDGMNGFRILGIDKGVDLGKAVSSAGDVNGDGISDILIGGEDGGVWDEGVTYVLFGRSTGFSATIGIGSLDGDDGFAIDGISRFDESGTSISSAGDMNGDGIADILIGAPAADPDGIYGAGETYVLFGRSTGFDARIQLSALDGANGFQIDGIDMRDASGRSVSNAGDVNGDGFGDILIGAPGADPNSKSNAGETYVLFGGATGLPGAPQPGEVLVGSDANDRLEGSQFGDDIFGLAGNDNLQGLLGDDLLLGGAGGDSLRGGVGNDTLRGEDDSDNLFGQSGNDVLVGGSGGDTLDGGAGADELLGGGAADFITFDGLDTFRGGAGRDYGFASGSSGVSVDLTAVSLEIVEGTGFDDIFTASPNTEALVVRGLGGDDEITLSNGNDSLLGNEGNDTLDGAGGDDGLVGGNGADMLTGGGGVDRFIYQTDNETGVGAGNRDIIQDFVSGVDRLILRDTSFTSFGGETDAFTQTNQLILDGDILKGTLDGVTTAFEIDMNGVTDLDVSDFVF